MRMVMTIKGNTGISDSELMKVTGRTAVTGIALSTGMISIPMQDAPIRYEVSELPNVHILTSLQYDSFVPESNRKKLNNKLTNLLCQSANKFEGCLAPTAELLEPVRRFLNQCSDDRLLHRASLFYCSNGTVFLKWQNSVFSASVNIGQRSMTYAIISNKGKGEDNGRIIGVDKYGRFYDKMRNYIG